MARVLVVDVIDKKDVHEAECNELTDFYKELHCDCFDIVTKKIGNKYYDVFVDDNGLFVDKPIPSMLVRPLFGSTLEPSLVGNLIFANHDKEGATTSLSDEDVALIKKNIIGIKSPEDKEFYPVVVCQPDFD